MLKQESKTLSKLVTITIFICFGANMNSNVQAVTFTPPEDGAPKDASSASSRGGESCSNNQSEEILTPSVIAVVPQSGFGTTLEKYPTILLYVSQPETSQALFAVKSSDKSTHYEMLVPLPKQPGIISVKLPSDAPALEIGEEYKWYFSIECENSWKPRYPVQGTIKRIIPPRFSSIVSEHDLLGTVTSYGQAGIWYDTAAMMFQLRTKQPANIEITRHWEELLNSVKLTKVGDEHTVILP